jgi:hypothetical protein
VIAVLHSTSTRITIAVVIAVLIHAGIFWLPYLHLPHQKVNLPPLSVRLESLSTPTEKPVAKLLPQNPISLSENGALKSNKPRPIISMQKMEISATAAPFPKRLQLSFTVFSGENNSIVGELSHELDIAGDRYILKTSNQATGMAGFKNKDRLTQVSSGNIGEHGLRPALYEEERINASGKQNLKATFDWSAHQLRYSKGKDAALPDEAQDVLSFMYQLSLLSIPSMRVESFSLGISNATQLELLQIEIGIHEILATPIGKLLVLHLRKLHSLGEPYFEIWLGMDYRMLPVKFKQVDGADKVIEEYVISDIRAAEEP